jgi:outer membrane protein
MRHLLLATACFLLPATQLSAATLQEAIARAYSSNPGIAAARAQVRQVDETVPIASSGARPSVSLEGSFSQELSDNLADLGQILTGGVTLRQSIWEGGRIRANVSAAEARIEAARFRLRALEQQLISNTVTAYADVVRTEAIVRLNESQVKVLE